MLKCVYIYIYIHTRLYIRGLWAVPCFVSAQLLQFATVLYVYVYRSIITINKQTNKKIYIYIYIYVCVCVIHRDRKS